MDKINFARFFDNSVCSIGIDINRNTISKDENHHTYQYETGAIWHESYHPTFCREAIKFPVNKPEDICGFTLGHLSSIRDFDYEQTRFVITPLHEQGYFVEGSVIGAWQAIYYYVTSFENILTWMLIELEAAGNLFKAVSDFSLASAEKLLSCGVDAIFAPSDNNDLREFKARWGDKINLSTKQSKDYTKTCDVKTFILVPAFQNIMSGGL